MSDSLQVKTPQTPSRPPGSAGTAAAQSSASVGKTDKAPPAAKLSQDALQVEKQASKASASAQADYSWFSTPQLIKPSIDVGSVIMEIRSLQQTMSTKQLAADRTNISIGDKRMASIHRKNLKKEKEIAKKLNEVQHESLWQKIAGWFSNIVNLIASIVATVVTGGAAAPLLGAAILGTAVMIMQETGGMKKLEEGFAKMFEAFGMNKEQAQRAAAITTAVTVAVVMVVTSIIATVASGGAAAEGMAATVFQVTKIVNNLAGAGLMVTQGSLDVATGVDNYQISDIRSDEQKGRVALSELDFNRQVSTGDIKRLSKEFQDMEGYIVDALSTQAETQEATIRNMA